MTRGRLPAPLDRSAQTFGGRSVEVLRELVLTGRLVPGERLNEVELAAALGISRGPLREAIAALVSEGLLTSVVNRGSFVRTVTAEQLAELYEVRIALETHAVRLVAGHAQPAVLAGLRDLLDVSEDKVSAERSYPRELDFHRRLVAITGNTALLTATTEVLQQIDLARARSAQQPTRARAALTEHEDVFGHLQAGRPEKAATALSKHLRSSLANALTLLDAQVTA